MVEPAETGGQFLVVFLELLVLLDLLALKIGQTENHLGGVVASALDDGFDELGEITFVCIVELDHHTGIDQIYNNFFLLGSDQLPGCQLLFTVLEINLFDSVL